MMEQVLTSQTFEQAMAKAWVLQILALTVLWFMYAYLYRPYRVDLMRQRLFAIRRNLFEDADNRDDLTFDDKPYIEVRSVINGMIRFAHELTFFEFLSLMMVHNKMSALRYRVEVERSFERLPRDLSERLQSYQGKITWVVLDHVMHVSIVPFLTIVPFSHAMEFTGRTRTWFNDKLQRFMRRPVFAILEQQARESGRDRCRA